MTSSGGVDLNWGHPTLTYDYAAGDVFDDGHYATEAFGNAAFVGDPPSGHGWVESDYPIGPYQAAPVAPEINLHPIAHPHNRHDPYPHPAWEAARLRDQRNTRLKYAAIAGAAAVTTGLGLAWWQSTPKDERSKAATNADPAPTAKAGTLKAHI